MVEETSGGSSTGPRYKDVYREYVSKGWQPIPLPYKAKKYPPKGVTGKAGTFYIDKIENPVHGWLVEYEQNEKREPAARTFTQDWANGNTALRADGWIGVDVDAYGEKHGDANLIQLEAELGIDLPKTYYVTSRGAESAARTNCFRVPAGMHFITEAAPDIDIIQETHRYSVVWPSMHPITERIYEWYGPDGVACGIPEFSDLPELPREFIEVWMDKLPRSSSFKGTVADPDSVDFNAAVDALSAGSATAFVMDKLPDGWEDGRYATLNQTLWHIAHTSIFYPKEPGLREIFDRVVAARMVSGVASTPEADRLNHIHRSFRGAIAKWTAERDEIPDAVMKWAASISSDTTEFLEPVPEMSSAATTAETPVVLDEAPGGFGEIGTFDGNLMTDPDDAPGGGAGSTGGSGGGGAGSGAKGKGKNSPMSIPAFHDGPLAVHVAEQLEGEAVFSDALGWLRWSGKVWRQVTEVAITEIVRDHLDELWKAYRAINAGDPARMKAADILLSAAKIANVAKLIKGRLHKDAVDFDTKYDWLNCPNGMVHLPTAKLYQHDYRYYFTKMTKANYVPGATHADWTMAKESLPVDSLAWLQWKFGQGITGYPASDDVVPFLRGDGENGKSAIITPIMNSLGDFANIVPDSVLLPVKAGGSNDVTTLLGVRVAIMEELPEARYLDTKRLKEVAGTEKMSGRFLYKDYITWSPTHTLFVTTNFRPQVSETDHGSWRRLALVEFPYRFRKPGQALEFPTDKVGDPDLRSRMKFSPDGQHEAVLAWLVAGAYGWYQRKKTLPGMAPAIEADTNKWRTDADLMYGYITDYLEFDPAGMIASSDLTAHFNWYLRNNGSHSWGRDTVSSRFNNNEQVKKFAVTKGRSSAIKDISRPEVEATSGVVLPDLPSTPLVWKGIKYKDRPITPPSGSPFAGWV